MRNFVPKTEKFRPPKVEKFCPRTGEILSPKWRNFVPQTRYIVSNQFVKKSHKYTIFLWFFIHFSCTEICIRLIRLIRLITGTPPPLDGRGAVPYPCRYLQKNQTTKKYQFFFIGKFKKHLNPDLVKNTNNYFLIKIKSQQKKKK